jgi:DNA-binding transcriptional MerR regulator
MFTIGEFARHGRVSVRMLRHYDSTGLLRPARIDPASGYRFYAAGQLARLNRIIALKDLGFTLDQVRTMLDQEVSTEQMRGMLVLRRAELRSQIAADTQRLGQVEARLRVIEEEGTMPAIDIQVKKIPAIRVAELTGPVAAMEPEFITPVIQGLYGDLGMQIRQAGMTVTGPAIAYYTPAPDGDGAIVHAALPVGGGPASGHPFEVIDLPEIGQAATIVHHGSMDNCLATFQVLGRWIEDNGYQSAGYARELYLECPADKDKWVTELQEPLLPA